MEEDTLSQEQMFFPLSKFLGFFALPSNFLIALGLVGLLLMPTRLARHGRRLVVASILLLALVGFSPLGNLLMQPLEDRFPAWGEGSGRSPDGIIVLGGGISPDVSAARGVPALNESGERLTATVDLARRYPQARVVFTGGDTTLVFEKGNEASAARQFFDAMGLPSDRILYEDRSRNTDENARFSKALVDPKPGERWLLVTSAYHMPRAMGVFRSAGFAVEPYPVDWRTEGAPIRFEPFPALADGLKRTDTAVREWVGLLIYWLTGRSRELFPGPVAAG